MFDLTEIDNKIIKLDTLRDQQTKQKNSLTKEILVLEDENSLLDKVTSLFKYLLDALLEEKKNEIEKLVTFGLKTVFTDQDLVFHINMEPKYNTLYTSFSTEMVGVASGDVMESFGGGIVNIESFLLRIITLFQTNLAPYIILDEAFSHLSEEYIENCSKLLKTLSEKMGLTIFIITHKEQMLSHADLVYKSNNINGKFIIEECK